MIISNLIICKHMSMTTGYRLADNSRQLRRLFDERVRSLGLTAAQARLLLSLERNPDENQVFHAEQLEIEPITLTRIVDRLEEAGWVERRSDPGDRRARILHLTDKSRGIVTRLRATVETLFEDMLGGFDPGERAAFASLLERIGANLTAARQPEVLNG
jgi:MarR family transcriptional regulator, transcriptional regulator for hemolysin